MMHFFRNLRFGVLAASLALGLAQAAPAAESDLLAEGEGKSEVAQMCGSCHDLNKAVSMRQDRNGWGATLLKMVNFGMEANDEQLNTILSYLVDNYPPQQLPPVNINTARAIQLEARLTLKRSEAAAIIKYRTENGKFASIEDLMKVPGIDAAKIAEKKDSIAF